ncbi:MAG: glycoside hydrolase family 125 protein, partial [Clostridia bacterium]|nr:glycoside hydrolase family 125 protein [Clostridia bacterium]
HTPKGYIWHIALIVQALTSEDINEIKELLKVLQQTDADTCYMHESFNPDNPNEFTRAWFSWADGLFAQLILKLYEKGLLENIV